MLRFHAITPTHNKTDAKGEPLVEFKGKTCGISFVDGEAYFDDISVPKSLGKRAEQIAREMILDFGYTVEVIDENGERMPFDPMAVHPTELVPEPVGTVVPRRRKA